MGALKLLLPEELDRGFYEVYIFFGIFCTNLVNPAGNTNICNVYTILEANFVYLDLPKIKSSSSSSSKFCWDFHITYN